MTTSKSSKIERLEESTEYNLTGNDKQLIQKFIRHNSANLSKNTERNRRTALRKWLDWCDSEGLDWRDADGLEIEDYMTHMLNNNYATRSVRANIYCVSTFYQRMIRRSEVGENPVEEAQGVEKLEKTQLEDSDEVEYLGDNEVEKLLDSAEERGTRDELIIRLMLDTGLRNSELCDIKIDDVDRDEREIEVSNAKSSRHEAAEERTVWYSSRTERTMRKWLDRGRRSSYFGSSGDYLICSKEAERIGERRISEIVRETASEAGIQSIVHTDASGRDRRRVTPHLLRKTYAVHATRRGMPLVYLSDLLGHSSVEITKEKYLKYRKRDRREAARDYSPRW